MDSVRDVAHCTPSGTHVTTSRGAIAGAEHMLGLRHQLLLPVLDLIRVYLELLGQIGQGTLASNGGQRDRGLKHWRMIAPCPLCHLLPLSS